MTTIMKALTLAAVALTLSCVGPDADRQPQVTSEQDSAWIILTAAQTDTLYQRTLERPELVDEMIERADAWTQRPDCPLVGAADTTKGVIVTDVLVYNAKFDCS